MENLPAGSESPATCDGGQKDKILGTLGGGSTDNEGSRQQRIDTLFDKALAAKEAGDMDTYNDYMKQIRENIDN